MNRIVRNRAVLTAVVATFPALSISDAPEAAEPAALEEIIVTAQKREQSLQVMPIAITAISGESLSRVGVNNVRDLRFLVPSMEIGTQNGVQTNIVIRGIGGEIPNIGGEAGVTVSQDGVPFARNVFFNVDFLDIERIEVLRGPQGTINGRNATGGAINVLSKRPTEEFEAGVELAAGDYSLFSGTGYVSGPIGDSGILGRLAFGTRHSDGWYDNTLLDRDLPGSELYHGRASFLADFSDNFEALLVLDFLGDDGLAGTPSTSIGRIRDDRPSLAEIFGIPDGDPEKLRGEAEFANTSDKEQTGATLRLTWDISDSSTLTSTTSYHSQEVDNTVDCDALRVDACAITDFIFDVDQVTQELTLSSDLSDRASLIFGGVYIDEEAGQSSSFASFPSFGGIPFGTFTSDLRQDLTSWAVYGQVEYRISDTVQLSVGGRYTDDKKDLRQVDFQFGFTNIIDVSDSWDAFTPRVSIDYIPSDDLTIYASVARGFKAGGFNSYASPANPFLPEFVWTYEAGAKILAMDDRVRMSATVFFSDYKDQQQNVFGLGGSIFPSVQNAGQSEILGIELELEAMPTDNLRFGLTGSYLDAEFTELMTADPVYPELGAPDPTTGLNVRDLSGMRLPRASKWQFSTYFDFSIALSDNLGGFLRVDYSWRDEFFFSIYNHANDRQDGYGLLNVNVGMNGNDGNWRLTAFARNLSDERYFVATENNSFIGQFIGFLGEPRTYGVKLSFDY